MFLPRLPFGRLPFLGIFAWSVLVFGTRAEPFHPRDDGQVLEQLRSTPRDGVGRQLRFLRTQLAADPNNLDLAVQLASRCIERSRSDGDPRFLGHAESALAPWWNLDQPPVPALVLRATIKQSQHQFTEALADLNQAIRLDPRNGQAWLTQATVLTVLGQYSRARQSCVPLLQLAPDLVAMTAAAQVASLTGSAQRAADLLTAALQRDLDAPPAQKVWALTVLAETLTRLGESSSAERRFQEALALDRTDPYLLGAFADFLLDQNRGDEVVVLLKEEVRIDPLLLRLALGEAALPTTPDSLNDHIETLRTRFEASRLRGDSVHAREEARYALRLARRPAEALRLAQANWSVQHEPADARILLESAWKVQAPRAALPALEFIKTNQLEDIHLAALATRLNSIVSR
jgi:tetratricopeptide (TPR) repeat protein